MAASAQLLISALSKPVGPLDSHGPKSGPAYASASDHTPCTEPDNPLDRDGLSDPDYGLDGASSSEWAEPPLTSEPPLAETTPLTSEPPLAAELPLTSEPTATGIPSGSWGSTDPMEV